MRAKGIDALLLKGWSIARLYAEPALRPLGDIDLLVRARDSPRARVEAAALATRPPVDLHTGLSDLTDRTVTELFDRSAMIQLGDTEVRILGREDQLRHLCLHFFRHAGARPLWLCDIAAALEAMPADFDWDSCLRGDALLTQRVLCAIRLAEMLLDARPARPLPAEQCRSVPNWLTCAVLESWAAPFDPRVYRPTALSLSLREPREILPAIARRWPNPIEATVLRAASLDDSPRLPVQLREAIVRVVRFTRNAWSATDDNSGSLRQ